MKNFVYVADEMKYEFDTIEELKQFVLPNLNQLTPQELRQYLYEKVFGLSMLNDLQIVDSSQGVLEEENKVSSQPVDFEKAIFIDNFDTYLLSLCKFNVVVLLEEVDHRYYTREEILTPNEKKYAIVNEHAASILKSLIGGGR